MEGACYLHESLPDSRPETQLTVSGRWQQWSVQYVSEMHYNTHHCWC